MKKTKSNWFEISNWFITSVIFLISLWLIIIQPLGPNLSHLPGDLIDTRFNNYILEHDFRWITGRDASLWDAPFFYPYAHTLTFSDNHFGSMLFYDAFRWAGLDRESALQGWYILSYFLNFFAASFVLKTLKLNPLAVGLGAFFFTFGLPVLAQENHVQLSYRFCIPLACFAIWQLAQKPHMKHLALLSLWVVWQFYLSIYLGVFLSLLLAIVGILLPLTQSHSFYGVLSYWPQVFRQAWQNTKIRTNLFYLSATLILLLSLVYLFQPYAASSKAYGFTRSWDEISSMLPRIKSYFISDFSNLWKSISNFSSSFIPAKQEHQLFVGMPTLIWLILGFIWKFNSPYKKMAFLFLGAAAVLVLITLDVRGHSLYKLLWQLPGVNSIRAVTWVILVLLWPIALFIAIEGDALLRTSNQTFNAGAIVLLLFSLMAAESIYFNHVTFSKAAAAARLQTIYKRIPSSLTQDPILYVWNSDDNNWYLTELDTMLVSQDLNWPAMNGYSGNLPNGYGPTQSCNEAFSRIISFMNFNNITDPSFYSHLISRVVPVGSEKCEWPDKLL